MNLNSEYRREKKEDQISVARTSRTMATSGISSKSEFGIFENQDFYEWLNTREAAEYLRISPKSLLNAASNGSIPHYKFGRRNRYLLSELNKLLLGNPRGGFHGN